MADDSETGIERQQIFYMQLSINDIYEIEPRKEELNGTRIFNWKLYDGDQIKEFFFK